MISSTPRWNYTPPDMPPRIDYADCHVTAYSRYVQRSAASARPHGPHTLSFQDWFWREYQALPGSYIGLNYAQAT